MTPVPDSAQSFYLQLALTCNLSKISSLHWTNKHLLCQVVDLNCWEAYQVEEGKTMNVTLLNTAGHLQ